MLQNLLFAEKMERISWHSDRTRRREASRQEASAAVRTRYMHYITQVRIGTAHIGKSRMREAVFWRVFQIQQTKENVSHVEMTKEKMRQIGIKSRQLLHR